MLKQTYPFYLGNKSMTPNQDLVVHDKYSGEIATRVAMASPADIDAAIGKAASAAQAMRELPAYKRQEILNHCVSRFIARQEELAQTLCIEAGKPIKDSRSEVTRLIDTFRIAAEEAVRIKGEVLPLDISARARDYFGMWKRVAVGACSFISPFNFPLNLVAHKVAPAIARRQMNFNSPCCQPAQCVPLTYDPSISITDRSAHSQSGKIAYEQSFDHTGLMPQSDCLAGSSHLRHCYSDDVLRLGRSNTPLSEIGEDGSKNHQDQRACTISTDVRRHHICSKRSACTQRTGFA